MTGTGGLDDGESLKPTFVEAFEMAKRSAAPKGWDTFQKGQKKSPNFRGGIFL